MKKLCYSAFIAFWASIATLVAVQVLATDGADGASRAETAPITLEELASHNSEQDCWIAVEGKVYDITTYVPKHPVPPAILLAWCGKEATEGMRTKGYGRDHSPAAWEMLDAYFAGSLAE
ncbi:MAG: cytochrome b5 domain-containing protein [Porticoccaceae bacterium]|nr:cytochrome b5 domain-containing protein [Porticoccaceae bacterium]